MPPASVNMKDEDSKMLLSFIDFLDKCLMLDPAKRLTPREALNLSSNKGMVQSFSGRQPLRWV